MQHFIINSKLRAHFLHLFKQIGYGHFEVCQQVIIDPVEIFLDRRFHTAPDQ